MKRTLWCDWSLSAPSAGLYPASRHLQWVDLQMTAQLWLAVAGGGCHDTVDAAQNRLHSISRHRNLDSPHHPSLLLIFFSSCASRPLTTTTTTLSLPSPSLLLLLLFFLFLHRQARKEKAAVAAAAAAAGGLVGVLRPAPPTPTPCSTGKALCSPLISVKDYLFVMCAWVCVRGHVCVCVRVGRCWGSVSWLWRLPHLCIIYCCWSCRSYGQWCLHACRGSKMYVSLPSTPRSCYPLPTFPTSHQPWLGLGLHTCLC